MIPLAQRLAEFLPEQHRHAPPIAPVKRRETAAEAVTQKIQDAFERGREAGRLAAEHAFAAARAEEERNFDRRLTALRDEWIADQAEQISRQLPEALAAIETRLAGSAAKILSPFLAEAVKQKAVGEFCTAVREAVNDKSESVLQMTGPQDLLDAIAARLGPLAKTIEFTVSQSSGVSARHGTTIFETRLTQWLAALKEPLP